MLSMQDSDLGSSGRTSVSAATRLFSWWVVVGGDTVRRCFGLGPDSGAAGLFILFLWSVLLESPWASLVGFISGI